MAPLLISAFITLTLMGSGLLWLTHKAQLRYRSR